MIDYIKRKYLLSTTGAKQLVQGMMYSALLNISYILPMSCAFLFIIQSLEIYLFNTRISYDISILFIMLVVASIFILILSRLQYDSVYGNTYTETAKTRIKLAETIRKLPLSYFSNKDVSDLTNTILGDVTSLEHAYSHALPQFAGALLSSTIIGIGISTISWKVALAVYWPVPILILVLNMAKNKKYKLYKEHTTSKRVVADKIQTSLENILEIKAYNAKDYIDADYKSALKEEEKKHFEAEISNIYLIGPLSSLLRVGTMTCALVSLREYLNSSIALEHLIIFIIMSITIYIPLEGIVSFFIELIMIEVPIDRMREIYSQKIFTGETPTIDNFNIEFQNVDFSYQEEEVISNLSCKINQGEITALVGPSGSGKSTLTKLILRFWDPNSGNIKIGGEIIENIEPEYLMKYFSMVFQDVVLFNNSVLENIRIGNKEASDEEVIEAAKLTCAHEFIEEMPDKYETNIGENGVLLSGGERQRISIARALLKDAPVIILDESTSSIDAENESAFQESLSKLIKNKTVIVIAHRLRTVSNADKIIVMESGRILEEGNFDRLMSNKGLFYKMWNIQKGEQN